MVERAAEGSVAQLLRRDEHHPRVSEPDPIQRFGPLGHRQQTVDGDAGADVVRVKARNLVRHEGDEGGDHDREGARLVVAGESRDLVAERLSGAGGEDPEDMPAGHRRLDDRLLHRAPVRARRLGAETLEAEPAGELPPGVVPFPAPRTVRVAAGSVPQPANKPSCLRELVADPGRHDRVAARYREPRESVGEGPALAGCVRHDLGGAGQAGVAHQLALDRCAGLGVGGSRRPAKPREEIVEPGLVFPCRRQPVPRD